MKSVLRILAIGPLLALATAAGAADPIGTWYTEDRLAQVRISPCGDALCGSIVALKNPIDPDTGRPQTDDENEDPAKRSRPLMGVQILIAMKPSGADKWSGQIYNAEDGKTYGGSIAIVGPNNLKVEGCIMGGLLCRSQIWIRVN